MAIRWVLVYPIPNMSRTESTTPIPRVALLSAVSSRHTNKPKANDLALFRVSIFWAEKLWGLLSQYLSYLSHLLTQPVLAPVLFAHLGMWLQVPGHHRL
jgi:hypothetical protein